MWPKEWPARARGIATATQSAVAAARAADASGLDEGVGDLAAFGFEQAGAVHSAIVRELLETLHPDGLSADDVQAVLERCARGAVAWLPTLDVVALAAVLTGALGVTDPDEEPRPDRRGFAESAVLVIADLVTAADADATGCIARAIGEIARAETIEMP